MKEINGLMVFDTYITTLEKTAKAFKATEQDLLIAKGLFIQQLMNYAKYGDKLEFEAEGMVDTIVSIAFDAVKDFLFESLDNYSYKANGISISEYWDYVESRNKLVKKLVANKVKQTVTDRI